MEVTITLQVVIALTVSGGTNNDAIGGNSTVGGGANNDASGGNSTVGGGQSNIISVGSTHSTIGGGFDNTASGYTSTISGGYINTASGNYSTTSGGYKNTASGNYSTIGGGLRNTANGTSSTVIGGGDNEALGLYSTVSGGGGNSAQGDYSWAGGKFASTGANNGTFAWADSTTLSSTIIPNAADQFAIKAAGGLRLLDGNQGAGKVLTDVAGDGVGTWQAAGGGGGSGHTIEDEGVDLAQRGSLNFVGAGVTATDDAGNDRTIVTISGGGGGHTIQDEGVAETTRTNLNFVGTGIDVTDDAGNDATVVTIDPIPVEINDLTDVNTSGSETLSITGTLSPDATGTYTLAGTHNGENYYTNGTYFVWNDGAGAWYLDNATSVQGGDETAAWSIGGFSPVNSTYIPLTGATGNATVTLNPAAGPAEGDVLSWDDTAGEWVTGRTSCWWWWWRKWFVYRC